MHAIIFADRFGYELWPVTEHRPVCMLPIANKPVLQLTIEELQQLGIRRGTVICSEHTELVSTYFGSGRALGMLLDYKTVSAPCCVELGIDLAGLGIDDKWIVVRGDIVRPFGFLEEALRRGKQAAESSIFAAMGICTLGTRGEPGQDLRWASLLAKGTIDPLNLASTSAYHRCNMKALDGDLPGFTFPGGSALFSWGRSLFFTTRGYSIITTAGWWFRGGSRASTGA
jgi:hypothetical protein